MSWRWEDSKSEMKDKKKAIKIKLFKKKNRDISIFFKDFSSTDGKSTKYFLWKVFVARKFYVYK